MTSIAFILIVGVLVVIFLLFLGYLSACAGADRFLTLSEWIG